MTVVGERVRMLIQAQNRIETQDTILKCTGDAERIIEIGPSQVLSIMVQKTISRKFLSRDRVRTTIRQPLS